MAGAKMKKIVEKMKNITLYEPTITIKSKMTDETIMKFNKLAKK